MKLRLNSLSRYVILAPLALLLLPLDSAQAVLPGAPAPGLYVNVVSGLVTLNNLGVSQNFSVGQFGFIPNFVSPPVVLPTNPNILFIPPPSFSSSSTATGGSGPAVSMSIDQIDAMVSGKAASTPAPAVSTPAKPASTPATATSTPAKPVSTPATTVSTPAKPASTPPPSSSSSVTVLGGTPATCSTITTAGGLLGTTTLTACGLPPTKK